MKRPVRKPRITPETRQLLRQIFVGVCVAVVLGIFCTIVWHVTRLEAFTIQSVAVADGPTVKGGGVQALVEVELEGSYFRLIPKRFAWLYPADAIEQAVLDIERIDAVSQYVESNTTLVVSFTEYQPYALWCSSADSADCLFVDISGYAYTAAPVLTGGGLVRFVTSDRTPQIGTQLTETEDLQYINWFSSMLEDEFMVYPARVLLYPDKRVTYELFSGGALFTTLRQDVAETFRYLETLLRSDDFGHLLDSPFQYVDLRFGNRLFVNETELSATTTPADSEEVVPADENIEESEVSEPADSDVLADEEVSPEPVEEEELLEPVTVTSELEEGEGGQSDELE